MNNQEITTEIALIKSRNERVELDKAWEISWTRKLLISAITYIVATIWLWVISENNILLKAVVPTAGYILSTISIPYVKKMWIKTLK